MIDNWELEFRKQVALDGHTIETLDNENAQLRARVAELEKQCRVCLLSPQKTMEKNLDRKLEKIKEQNAFIAVLEKKVESMRNCGNCGISVSKCAGDFDWMPVTIQRDCVDNGMKHWQPLGNDEGGAL